MSEYYEIPLSQVEEGYIKSKKRCLNHIQDSKILLSNMSLGGAALLAIFALEELGRMKYLFDGYFAAKRKSVLSGLTWMFFGFISSTSVLFLPFHMYTSIL